LRGYDPVSKEERHLSVEDIFGFLSLVVHAWTNNSPLSELHLSKTVAVSCLVAIRENGAASAHRGIRWKVSRIPGEGKKGRARCGLVSILSGSGRSMNGFPELDFGHTPETVSPPSKEAPSSIQLFQAVVVCAPLRDVRFR